MARSRIVSPFGSSSRPTRTARYGDTFVKKDGAWLFAERNLYVDWIEGEARREESRRGDELAHESRVRGLSVFERDPRKHRREARRRVTAA